jgi:2,3-bisphosphoglycerate-dependent phosphoglycerate mutase
MKTIYIVRHCQAEGQEAEAPLTADGLVQADRLADLLMDSHVERIISSPYVRAKDSVAPLAGRLKLPVELDERLVERVLCAGFMNDWQQHLEASFRDLDLCLEGGESSRAAMRRIVSVVDEIQKHPAETTLLATHGNLTALLLKYFDDAIGFTEWQKLTNPDVYRIALTQPPRMHRL